MVVVVAEILQHNQCLDSFHSLTGVRIGTPLTMLHVQSSGEHGEKRASSSLWFFPLQDTERLSVC